MTRAWWGLTAEDLGELVEGLAQEGLVDRKVARAARAAIKIGRAIGRARGR
ncbi:MAG: hypothetical protein QUS11_04140 [Candidatus Fermentibacter sp.]|nr:hypothetical protein [Candidatus Fermentibacter sp.]